jgi:hypothetical protein
MKYNEAIDIILDGGKAYNDIDESIVYYFHKRGGNLIFSEIDEKQLRRTKDYGYGMDAILTRKKIDANWIVAKDGVVYEEYPIGKMHIIEQKVPIDMIKKMLFIKDRTYNQDEPAELEEGGKPWEKTKMPIIADKVNEDWLEKKILCFMNKYLYIRSGMNLKTKQGKCSNRVCPFCLPQEEEKTIPIDELKCPLCNSDNLLITEQEDCVKRYIDQRPEERKCNKCNSIIAAGCPRYALESIPSYCYCLKCWNEMSDEEINRNDHIEEPRDKVTVDDILFIVKAIKENFKEDDEKAVNYWTDSLVSRITYLVSLQEKL